MHADVEWVFVMLSGGRRDGRMPGVCIRLASSCRLQSGDIIKIPRYRGLELGSVSAETRSPGPGAGTEEMGSRARGSTFTCHRTALFQINMKRDNGRYITPV